MDATLERWLNQLAADHGPATGLISWVGDHFAAVVVLTVMAGGLGAVIADLRRHGGVRWQIPEAAAIAAAATAAALAVDQAIGHLWFRDRPYEALGGIHLLGSASGDPSFPSDHAAAAFAIALGIGAAMPRLAALLLAEAIALSLSRVAMGVHYPGDVVGGLLVAAGSVALFRAMAELLRPRLLGRARQLLASRLRLRDEARPSLASGARFGHGGLFASLVVLPAVLELTVDPVRLHPRWLEIVTLAGLGALLLALFLLLEAWAGAIVRGRTRRSA